jgi:hypothetical protein
MSTIQAAHSQQSLRRALHTLLARLTRKASINISMTVHIPMLLTFSLHYAADISDFPHPANENKPRRVPAAHA